MNNIELSTVYLPLLDKVYKQNSKTSILEGDEATMKRGDNGELKVAILDMDALGDFSRNDGYTKGSTTFRWETIKYDKERSQDLRIDRLDNAEALRLPFAKLSSEFIRTKVVPETDAARIAKIAGTEGISTKAETLSGGEAVVSALRACSNKMDEDEVDAENRILFITPTLRGEIADLDTTKSKEVLSKFSTIIEVPQTRMYTKIELKNGKTEYGYAKATDGKEINFLCVEKSAAVVHMEQFIKYFTPDEDQDGDDNVFKYRNNNLYGHVYENKLAGIYCSYKAE
jgi:hypothetical protein|uniref:Major capsid protein n=1 Tax=Siphoviridae sp. ctGQT3 TaxID=2825412 RepID=A0A8S5UDY0_9CAUD|nr:MAG TPA: Major capsid protein [Siphoviridae sp. ctGQT3]